MISSLPIYYFSKSKLLFSDSLHNWLYKNVIFDFFVNSFSLNIIFSFSVDSTDA